MSRGLELEVLWELSVFVSDQLIELLLVETCGPSQVSPSQVGPFEVGFFQVGLSQVGPSQVGPFEVGSYSGLHCH
jgi:hypothetical protein